MCCIKINVINLSGVKSQSGLNISDLFLLSIVKLELQSVYTLEKFYDKTLIYLERFRP